MKTNQALSALNAVSPLDGRYASRCDALRPLMSEAGFMAHRVEVEIAWLIGLSEAGLTEFKPFSTQARDRLRAMIDDFSETDAERIKQIERVTNHDVKAVEYWLKEQVAGNAELEQAGEFIHFACTSEDINNTSHALMLGRARDQVLVPQLQKVLVALQHIAHTQSAQPMLARTHGQPATPTTLGKEFANVAARVRDAIVNIQAVLPLAKMNGATGNYNAHMAAYPEIDWQAFSAQVLGQLGLQQNTHTIQIEPHDWMAALFDAIARTNTILIDLNRDIWGYIALGFFKQRLKEGEVGSSTMPHKVNPIDFANAEGNLGLSNTLFSHFANKLTQSRMQRDLSDSTVLRNVGVAFAYALIAYQSMVKGNEKLQINQRALSEDLADNWEILSEAIQTVMRRYNVPNAYEQMRDLTRGRRIEIDHLQQFIRSLDIPNQAKKQLLALTPETYTGLAAQLVKAFS